MSERFDREASLALKAAVCCARRLGALEVGGEHILVGIAAVPSPVAARLTEVGADARRLEEAVARGVHDAGCWRASESTWRRLGTRRIRGEHLVLGLLDTSIAARELLLALDIDPTALRRSVLRALADAG